MNKAATGLIVVKTLKIFLDFNIDKAGNIFFKNFPRLFAFLDRIRLFYKVICI